jgi:phosphoglucosamine mutase
MLFMKFSGSSGIRMKWSEELINLAYQLGISLGNEYGEVVVASDFRYTSDSLVSILAGAIMAVGGNVYYGGKAPTPSLAYAAKNHDAGLMVTASHNPPEYNGIKLWNPDGSAFSEEQMHRLERKGIKSWRRVGKMRAENIIAQHRDALLREFGGLELKVVIDCSNGAGSLLTPLLLRELGARVTAINCHPSGQFPGHPSEPSEENLTLLKRFVIGKNADLGIAHDGDADRFIAITPSGRYLSGDYILAIFTKLLGFRRIVAPVDSSMLLDNFAEVLRCKVGDANVSQVMKESGAEFGGENSGTQIFARWRYTPDAIYAALKFAKLAMSEDMDEIVEGFPSYHTLRKSLYYEDRELMEKKIESFVKDYEVERVDGYRVSFDDGWFLIRFSGTEPKVRITVEFESEQRAEKVLNEVLSALK